MALHPQIRPPSGRHVFVDESKRGRYLLVASVHLVGDLPETRKVMRDLLLPGQRRIHMTKESDRRRRLIADAIGQLSVEAVVYEASRSHGDELSARHACLEAFIGELPSGETTVVIERDDSLLEWDRRTLFRLARSVNRPELVYRHQRAHEEQLLAIPDAIAWCWAKGGEWRRRVAAVTSVRRI